MKLVNRAAIITGASQGLGRAIAEQFVREGASVLLVARTAHLLANVVEELRPLAKAPGQKVECLSADIASLQSCTHIVSHAVERLSNLSILVNNAGVYGPLGRFEEIDWGAWEEAIRINLFGTAMLCRAILPVLRQQHYGKIINLSGGGATAPLPRISAYAASKAAVVRLTETLAEELKDDHIDVNAVAPGALNTRMLDEVLSAGPERVGQSFYDKALKQRDQGGAPLERGASLAVFLASAESDGITGRLLSAVWDDWARLAERRGELARSDIYTLRRIMPEDRGQKWNCA